MIDMSGETHGNWRVIGGDGTDERGEAKWLCECSCGSIKSVLGSSLRNGRSRSCGCLRRQMRKESATVHGKSNTKLYNIWRGMRQRCGAAYSHAFKWYGQRGIAVCKEWDEFETFYKWSMENGYSEGLSLDRINNDGDYEPDNCRWTAQETQSRNRSNNINITYNGETHCLWDWAKITGIKPGTLYYRYHAGKAVDEIFKG